MEFFVSFFQSFFSLPEKEEAPHPMATNHRIRSVVEENYIWREFQHWGKELTDMRPEVLVAVLPEPKVHLAAIEQRFRNVNSCRVTKIEHYRQANQSIAHECIILHIRSPKDSRYARLDHFKPNDEMSPSRYSVEISDRLRDVLPKKYELVQSVELPSTETLTVVHCAAIGASVTNAAKDYSTLHHMSMWWAAMFFSTAHRFLTSTPTPIIQRGSLYKEAGKIYGIHFVKPDATLATWNQGDTDTVVNHANEDSQALLAEAVKSDVEKLKSSRLVIDDIVSSAKAKEKEMRAAMEMQVERQKESIAELVALEANRAAELAALDAAIAERDAAIAERDAKHAAEMADLTNQLKSARGQGSGRRS